MADYFLQNNHYIGRICIYPLCFLFSCWAGLQSIEVLLQMASSTSPKSPKLNLTNTHDGWYFDDKDVRTHSSHQLTKIHVDNASMQNAMEQQVGIT